MNKAVFGFVFLLLFASLVSARTLCDDDQLIMRLSGAENAHGAVYDYGAYDVEICYNQIFGESFKRFGQFDGVNNTNGMSGKTVK